MFVGYSCLQSGELPWFQSPGGTGAWGWRGKDRRPRWKTMSMFLQYAKDNVFLVCCVILCAWVLGWFCMCVCVAWLWVCMCVCVFLRDPETERERHSERDRHIEIQREGERCGFFQEICATDTAQWPMSTFSERSHTAHFKEAHAGNKSLHILWPMFI